MRRVALALAIVSGVIIAPLLCEAGVLIHDCICDTTECCAEEVACELDPCVDVYRTEEWRKHDPITTAVPALLIGVDVAPAGESRAQPSQRRLFCNRPYPDSDQPLRI